MAARQEDEELRRYRRVQKAVASGIGRWSEIKRAPEVDEGVEVDDRSFSDLLKKLVKAGLIEKGGGVRNSRPGNPQGYKEVPVASSREVQSY